MYIEKAFEIIETNIDDADFFGPIPKEKILIAEKILGVKFPNSYSKFLENYGSGDISGLELFGIIKDPELDNQMIPNGIWLTLNLRGESCLPNEYVVISETGYGPYYVLKTSCSDDELSVFIWDTNNQIERVADSFGEFLLNSLEDLY